MARTVAIGHQDYETVRKNDYFYIDKTEFIREWWNAGDIVTLITRPRRFGKTLNMSMTEQFFSVKYAGRSDLFEGMDVWKDEKMRILQGTYPVVFLTFAGIKETSYASAREGICRVIEEVYNKCDFLTEGDILNAKEKRFYSEVTAKMDDSTAAVALRNLSDYLCRYYGKKTILILDEYDTPMQEAYVNGYWKELAAFTRSVFNYMFKTNPYLERALLTGITRVIAAPSPLGSKIPRQVDEVGFPAKLENTSLSTQCHSIFSDLNNLKVVTTTSEEYADSFGFTEKEVFEALDEYGMSERKQDIKKWYDGFTFGNIPDIYNPWSVINFLDTGKLQTFWANSSSNQMADELIRRSSKGIKENFETLLGGGTIQTQIDEQIIYDQLTERESAIWSLFLASGYLKAEKTEWQKDTGQTVYFLSLTNLEVRIMFENMIRGWFADYDSGYNDFVKALLLDDIKAMNLYMNRVALATFSFFDTGRRPSAEKEPERFYHGFVLGLIVELEDRYMISSNRESGFGRYDVILEPRNQSGVAMILEFKVRDPEDEKSLHDTVQSALEQIRAKKYGTVLIEKGFPEKRIRYYGFAFEGKKVLIARG